MTDAVVVLGLGNELLRDDGVGVHAARALGLAPEPGCTIVEVGTAVLDALDLIEHARAVIALDAVECGVTPGTVVRFELAAEAHGAPSASLHDFGLSGVLRLIPPETRPPVVVIGVQPSALDVGLELTAPVAAALPLLIEAVRREVRDRNAQAAGGAAGGPAVSAAWRPETVTTADPVGRP